MNCFRAGRLLLISLLVPLAASAAMALSGGMFAPPAGAATTVNCTFSTSTEAVTIDSNGTTTSTTPIHVYAQHGELFANSTIPQDTASICENTSNTLAVALNQNTSYSSISVTYAVSLASGTPIVLAGGTSGTTSNLSQTLIASSAVTNSNTIPVEAFVANANYVASSQIDILATVGDTPPSSSGNLGSGLNSATSYSSLTFAAPVSLDLGDSLTVSCTTCGTNGTQTSQTVYVSQPAEDATTVSVYPFSANASYPTGSPIAISPLPADVSGISIGTTSTNSQYLLLDMSTGTMGPLGAPCSVPVSVNLGTGGTSNAMKIIGSPGVGVTMGTNGISLATGVIGACSGSGGQDLTFSNVSNFTVQGKSGAAVLAAPIAANSTNNTSITLTQSVSVKQGQSLTLISSSGTFQTLTSALAQTGTVITVDSFTPNTTYAPGDTVSGTSYGEDTLSGSSNLTSCTSSCSITLANPVTLPAGAELAVSQSGSFTGPFQTLIVAQAVSSSTTVSVDPYTVLSTYGGGNAVVAPVGVLSSAGDAVTGSQFGSTATLNGWFGCFNVFVVGQVSDTIDGVGGQAVLDLSNQSSNVTVNANLGKVTVPSGSSSATDTVSQVQTFIGSAAGGTTFSSSSSGGLTFVGQGLAASNLLDLSAVSNQVTVTVSSTSSANSVSLSTSGASGTFSPDTFAGIAQVSGSASGSTTFALTNTATGGFAFTGQGGGNTLDLSAQSNSLRVDVTTSPPTVSGLSNGNDTFSGINTVKGSGGTTTFVAGSSGGWTFDASQSLTNGNTLDLSSANAGVTVDLTGTATCLSGTSACVENLSSGSSPDDQLGGSFANVVTPSAGSATVDAPSGGGYTFTGKGTASTNTLDLSAAPAGITVTLGAATSVTSSVSYSPVTIPIVWDTFPAAGNFQVYTSSFGSTGQWVYCSGYTGSFPGSSGSLTGCYPSTSSGAPLDTTSASVSQNEYLVGTGGGLVESNTSLNDAVFSVPVTAGSTQAFVLPATFVVSGSTFTCGQSTSSQFTQCTTPGGVGISINAGASIVANPQVRFPSGQPDQVSGFGSIIGSASGSTKFISYINGGFTFTGKGLGNQLDLTQLNAGLTINVNSATATVTGITSGGSDTFVGITTVITPGSTTFVAGDTRGYTFIAEGTPSSNTLDLSAGTTAVTVDVSGSTSSFVSTQVAVPASPQPGTTIYVSSTQGFPSGSFSIEAGGTTITCTGVGSGSLTGCNTTNPSGVTLSRGTPVVLAPTVSGTSGTSGSVDQFTGITQLIGSGAGTTFIAGATGGYSFTGKGSTTNNSLNLATAPAGITLDVTNGTVSGLSSGGNDTFSGISAFTGPSAGSATFRAGATGGFTFTGAGTGNTLNLGSANSGITVNIVTGKISGLTSGTDAFSGVSQFIGPTAGGAAFVAPETGGLVITGQGGSNSLDLSSAPALITVNVTNGVVSGLTSAGGGSTTDSFAGLATFVGSSYGETTFVAGTAGGFTFTGQGNGNTCDLSDAPPGITIDASTVTGTVSGLSSGGNDTFTGVSILKGSTGGSVTFKGGAIGGFTFTGQGNSNVLDLSAANSGIKIDLTTASATVSGLTPGANDSFTGISTVVGSAAGSTTFRAGQLGGYTLTGQGANDILDLGSAGALSSDITVDVTGAQLCPSVASDCVSGLPAGGVDAFSDMATIDGASAGTTIFKSGASGGYTFNGAASTTNTLDLTAANSGITVNMITDTASGFTTGTSSDSFSNINTVVGSSAGSTDFEPSPTGGVTFVGKGTASTNVLNLSAAPAGVVVDVTGSVVCLVSASQCIENLNASSPGAPTADAFSGIGSFVGATGGSTTFRGASIGGFSFSGQGTGNVIDLSASGSGLTFNLTGSTPTITGLSGGNDTFSDIQSFIGSNAGANTFVSPASGGFTFKAAGPSNALNLSAAASGLQVSIGSSSGVVTGTVSGLSGGQDSLSGITSFTGSSSGSSSFLVGNSAGASVTFAGQGSGNSLSFANVPDSGASGVTLSLVTLQATMPSSVGGTVTFSDISSFTGSPGNDRFIVGTGSYSFSGGGGTDTLDFTSVPVGVSINLTTSPAQATFGSSTDTFSGFVIFVGSTQGANDFVAAASGGYSFEGQGTASTNVLNLSAATGPITVDVTGTALCPSTASDCVSGLAGGVGSPTTDSFSGIGSVTGPTGGSVTFLGGSNGGFSFTGQGPDNTLDLSAASSGVTFNLTGSTPTVTGLSGGNDTFSDIQTFVGSRSGANTFVSPSAGGFTFEALGSSNSLNLSAAASGLTVSVGFTGTPSGPLPGSVSGLSGGSDNLLGITQFTGSSSGSTSFDVANPGGNNLAFTGQGSGNSLSFAGVPDSGSTSGVTVNLVTGSAQLPPSAGSGTVAFADIVSFTASLGNDRFVVGSGNDTFIGGGGTDTLDFSSVPAGVSINLTTSPAQATTSSFTDTFSGFTAFVGSSQGSTTFVAPSAGGYAFTGEGTASTNTLNLSAAPAGTTVDVTGTAACPTTASDCVSSLVTGIGSATTDSFSGISTFIGSSSGSTSFRAGSVAGFTFFANGTGNRLDLSSASSGVTFNLTSSPSIVSGLTGGTDTFSDIQTLLGSASAGGNTFVAPATGGFTFSAGGSANTLDLSSANAGITVDVTGTGSCPFSGANCVSGLTSGGDDTFSGISVIKGSSSGSTTFKAGTQSGFTFEGGGAASGNTLDLAKTSAGTVIDVTDTVVCLGGAVSNCVFSSGGSALDAFSGIDRIIGPSGGAAVFRAGTTGGFTFAGQYPSNPDNSLDLTAANSAITVDLTAATPSVSGLSSGGNDTFIGVNEVTGSASGSTTFKAVGSGGYIFTGKGVASTNTLDLSAASGGVIVDVTGTVACPTVASDCVSALGAGIGGSTFDAFSGIATVDGALVGSTTFEAGSVGGFTFTGRGTPSSNSLVLSGAGAGIRIDASSSPISVSGLSSGGDDSASGLLSITGSSAGYTTFVASSIGGYTFIGGGTASTNTLDLAGAGSGLTIDVSVPSPVVKGLSAGATDTFTDIASVIGPQAGSATFVAGNAGGYSLNGGGTASTNTLNLAGVSSGSPLVVDVSGLTCAAPASACVTGVNGGQDSLSGIALIIGSSSGYTTFRAGSTGGYSFAGGGSPSTNVMDLSGAGSGVTVNVTGTAPTVLLSSGSSDTFTGIDNIIGASVGHNTFVVGQSGGYSFSSAGGSNLLNLSAAGSGTVLSVGVGSTTVSAPVTVPAAPQPGVTITVSSTSSFPSGFSSGGTLEVDGASVTCSGMTATSFTGCTTTDSEGVLVRAGDTIAADASVTGLSSGIDVVGGVSSFLGSSSGSTTFRAGDNGGYSFTGQSGGNVLDFSLVPAGVAGTVGVTVNLVNGTASLPGTGGAGSGGTDTFAGIANIVGSPDNDTFELGTGSYSVTGGGGTDTADFSAVPSSVTVNATTTTVTVTGSGVSDLLTGVTIFIGSSAGGNTFKAGNIGGLSFEGGSSPFNNTLDLSGVTSSTSAGATVCMVVEAGRCSAGGTVLLPGGGTDSFLGMQSFNGTSYDDTFVVGQGTFTFTGHGSIDTLDYSVIGTAVTIDVAGSTGSASGGNVADSFSGFNSFLGPVGGGSTFKAGASGGYRFIGQGPGNTLDFSAMASGAGGVLFNLASGTATPNGAVPDSFSGISNFIGSPGNDTFDLAPGTFSLTAGGGTDTANLGSAPSGTTVDLAAAPGTITGAGWSDTIVGIFDFFGSSSGGTDFIAGPGSGYSFIGQGNGNTLDLSAAPLGITVDDSTYPGAVYNLSGGGSDSFSGIQTFLGSTLGGTTFKAPTSGGITFDGQGPSQGNNLDLAALPAGITVYAGSLATAAGPVSVPSSGSGVSVEVISTAGFPSTPSFLAGGSVVKCTGIQAAPAAFTGCTTTNPSGVAIASGEQLTEITYIKGLPANDTISDISGFTGSSGGGTTFVAGPIGGYSFDGLGSGNTISLAAIPAGPPGSAGAVIDAHSGLITLDGGSASDTTSGIQTFIGSPNDDTFVAGPGNLTFESCEAANLCPGATGTDTVSYRFAPAAVDVNLSSGQVTGGWGGFDTLEGIQNVIGSSYNDVIEGNDLPSILTAGGGNTTFVLVGGNDVVNGGTGNSTIDVSKAPAAVTIDLNDPNYQDTGGAGYTLIVPGTIRNVIGSPFGTTVLGGPGSGTITGSSGTDWLSAGAGNTTIDAGSGTETLVAGSGNDILNGGQGNDTFVPGTGNVTVNGGSGTNTLDFSGAPAGVDVNLSSQSFVVNLPETAGLPGASFTSGQVLAPRSATGGWGGHVTINNVNDVIGTNFNDIIVGNGNSDLIKEGSGNDLIVSNGGGSEVTGGGGNDVFMSGPGNNIMTCGGGDCTIDYSNVTKGSVNVNLATGTAQNGFGGTDTLIGFHNVIGSANGNDTLVLGPPGGIAIAGSGNSSLYGSAQGFDTLIGGSGNDTFVAGAGGHDTIIGGSGTNTIYSNNGQPDNINGGSSGDNSACVDQYDTVTNVQNFFPCSGDPPVPVALRVPLEAHGSQLGMKRALGLGGWLGMPSAPVPLSPFGAILVMMCVLGTLSVAFRRHRSSGAGEAARQVGMRR